MSTLTLDALAAATKVPSRTIRFYQAQGLLPPPELRGRVAWYGEAHVERLQLVATLKERGLQIKAIGGLLARVDRGEVKVSEWLGLDEQLGESWADDSPRAVDAAELAAMVGELTPAVLKELLRLRFVEQQGETYLVARPALVQLAVRMAKLGVELEVVADAARLLRKRFAKTAGELAELFLPGRKRKGLPASAALREVRPIALEAVRLIFAQEMEGVLREWSDRRARG